jgi:hypothetical protein
MGVECAASYSDSLSGAERDGPRIGTGMGEAPSDEPCYVSAAPADTPHEASHPTPAPRPRLLEDNTRRAHTVGRLMYGAVFAGAGAFAPFLGVFFAGLGCSKEQVRHTLGSGAGVGGGWEAGPAQEYPTPRWLELEVVCF